MDADHLGKRVAFLRRESLVHRSPEELVASILEKEQRIIEIVGRVKTLWEKPL